MIIYSVPRSVKPFIDDGLEGCYSSAMQRAIAFLATLFLCYPLVADTAFTILGARATGLAGAYTAVADDATAYYWNPAGVARGPWVRLGFFAGEADQDWGDTVNRLRSGEAGKDSQLLGDRAWGFATGFTVLGVAVTRFTHTQTVLDGDTLRSQGLQTWDVAATFVQSLPPDDLIIGVSARYIRGTAYSEEIPRSNIPKSEQNVASLVDRALQSTGRSESEPGIDLGIVYQPTEWVRLGLNARNLNRPTFHTDVGEPISLERHVRAGAAFFPTGSFLVSLDVDVSGHNDPGFLNGWRELAWGVEKTWREKTFALRGGLRTEISEGGLSRPGFAAGVGWTIKGLNLEAAAITSTRQRLGALWVGVSFIR